MQGAPVEGEVDFYLCQLSGDQLPPKPRIINLNREIGPLKTGDGKPDEKQYGADEKEDKANLHHGPRPLPPAAGPLPSVASQRQARRNDDGADRNRQQDGDNHAAAPFLRKQRRSHRVKATVARTTCRER